MRQQHPELVAVVMQSAASDLAALRLAVAIERVAEALLAEDETPERRDAVVPIYGSVRGLKAWLKGTNLWLERTNPRKGSELLKDTRPYRCGRENDQEIFTLVLAATLLLLAALWRQQLLGDFYHPSIKGGVGPNPVILMNLLKIWDQGDRGQRAAVGMYLAGGLTDDALVEHRPAYRQQTLTDMRARWDARAQAVTRWSRCFVPTSARSAIERKLVVLYAFKRKYPCADFEP